MAEIRVLVVEDERPARDLLTSILEDDGYNVCAVADGQSAIEVALTFHPNLALIDGLLPGGHGAQVANGLRRTENLPIIFVTGADSAETIHSAFRMGADDYIVKPFDAEELSWRVRAVLRRAGHAVAETWECGDLGVDEAAHTVARAGWPVALTGIEFKILALLIRNRTRLVSRAQLRTQVWGYDTDDHVLEVHMSSLRAKLEAHGPRMIQTVRGMGYLLHA